MLKNADLFMKVDDLGDDFEHSMSRLYFLFEGIAHTESSLDDEEAREKLTRALSNQRDELYEILRRFRELEDELQKEAAEGREQPVESRRELLLR